MADRRGSPLVPAAGLILLMLACFAVMYAIGLSIQNEKDACEARGGTLVRGAFGYECLLR